MRPREESLANEEHSWLLQSGWEDAAGKLILRKKHVRKSATEVEPAGWETGVNLGWK